MLTLEHVKAAGQRIAGFARVTPLIQSSALDRIAGAQVFLKAENLQKGGAFKFRGAANKLLSLAPEQQQRGVIAYSSGNHALSVSLAAAEFGMPAVVVMPHDAPSIKIEGARANGAEVILYDRDREDREAICNAMVAARGLTLVAPFDDFEVMAGAGTSALEAIGQLEPGQKIDAALVCCGGGGLTSGWATVVRAHFPDAQVLAVEPEHFDDTGRSLREGVRLSHQTPTAGAICDSLLVQSPGKLTFPVMLERGVQGATVTEQEVLAAMRFAFEHLKLVLEPGGAVALAAILGRKFKPGAQSLLAILSGGNVDPGTFGRCLR